MGINRKAFAIVAVGYNRPHEMKRLLRSVCGAEFKNIQADLIISLDFSDKQEELKGIAGQVEWSTYSNVGI